MNMEIINKWRETVKLGTSINSTDLARIDSLIASAAFMDVEDDTLGLRSQNQDDAYLRAGWISSKTPPPDDAEVLIWWDRAGRNSVAEVYVGSYCHVLEYWRPRGTNGNFSDEVTHWMPKPVGPVAESV